MSVPKFTYEDRDSLTVEMMELMERVVKAKSGKYIPSPELDKFCDFIDDFLEKYCTDGHTKFNF